MLVIPKAARALEEVLAVKESLDHRISIQRRWVSHLGQQIFVRVGVVVEVLGLVVCSIERPQFPDKVDLCLRGHLVNGVDMADIASKAARGFWEFLSHDRIVGTGYVRLLLAHLVVVGRRVRREMVERVAIRVVI